VEFTKQVTRAAPRARVVLGVEPCAWGGASQSLAPGDIDRVRAADSSMYGLGDFAPIPAQGGGSSFV